eukprot:scaffold76664_cov41-Prasinocladus_malaysianus.AAC.1
MSGQALNQQLSTWSYRYCQGIRLERRCAKHKSELSMAIQDSSLRSCPAVAFSHLFTITFFVECYHPLWKLIDSHWPFVCHRVIWPSAHQ